LFKPYLEGWQQDSSRVRGFLSALRALLREHALVPFLIERQRAWPEPRHVEHLTVASKSSSRHSAVSCPSAAASGARSAPMSASSCLSCVDNMGVPSPISISPSRGFSTQLRTTTCSTAAPSKCGKYAAKEQKRLYQTHCNLPQDQILLKCLKLNFAELSFIIN
jgi:hypothetical protein